MENKKYKIEVCVDSVESCVEAIKGGADRLELCSSLFLGGLTPCYGMMKIVRQVIPKDFPVFVMIRPRQGDFLYSEFELLIMKEDIKAAKELGYQGVVLGVLDRFGNIDIPVLRDLVQLATPMSVTFHRAFDMVSDCEKALKDIISVSGPSSQIQRILTSGQESTVLEGLFNIKKLMVLAKECGSSVIMVPGGGITERNLSRITQELDDYLSEFHISGRVPIDSQMQHRNTRVFMGGELRSSEYTLSIVDSKRISNFTNQILSSSTTK
ncbi:copper homeostasis protein [Tieghemostelium lacteum]|uniref:Copper homeostasis protein cutC homolog n=1 Tax=Tieghemostelium lacteum TaxID=361077 RepID=A0A152A1K8_TIELA|nr:copper homeostasis protein [Tieghemostelium lacteum]|eukprot:KYR00100.1 copper homeostasis protein [Tieghemostelium lacteum]